MSANNQSAQGGDNHINLYEPHVWKHHTKVAGVEWKNPVGTASGTFQYAAVRWFYDVSQLGAVCTKGASPVPWEGNPSPRTAESPAANINAVGLQNPGIDHYLAEDLPKLKAAGAFVISNVAGHCDDDYAAVVEKLADSDADMLEINVSCPNVSAGGMSVGTDPVALANLMDRLRPMTDKPMIVKLTPNVTDITVPARAAVEHGADALSMINTLKGMRINIRTGKPIIANVTGGVSGPAVLPVGLAAVYRVRTALPEIPIIGLGGIDSGEKALEYLIEKRPVIMAYRVIFSLVTFVGATTTLEVVWNFSDTMNGLMIIPNLICLLWLNKDIAQDCFDYEEHVVAFEKKGQQIDYQGGRARQPEVLKPCFATGRQRLTQRQLNCELKQMALL